MLNSSSHSTCDSMPDRSIEPGWTGGGGAGVRWGGARGTRRGELKGGETGGRGGGLQ